MAFTETFGGTTIYPSDVSYRAISLSANQTLAWPLEVATSGNVVAQIMDVTPSAGGFTITMPPANEASPGETALFFNAGAHNFTVADNAGNTIVAITPGLAYQIYLRTNTTAAGQWRTTQFGAGTSSATAGSLVGAGIKAINTTLNQSMAVTSLSVNYTAGAADRSAAFLWTGGAGTITLPAASTVGNDWFFHIRNGGTGAISLATTGGELINGTATVDFNPGDSAIIVCDGTGYFTIGFGQAPEFLFDYVSIDLTSQSSPYTLAGSNLNRIAYQFSGTLATNMQIIVPATIQQYWVGNFTTGGSYTLTVKTSAGTGVVVPRDARAILYCNGTNVVTADTGGISIPILVSQGGTGATNASSARTNLGATSIGNALFIAVDEATARNAIIAAKSGANSDITSLTGLTTPLSVPQGGTGAATFTANGLIYGSGTSALGVTAVGTTGQVLVGNTGGAPSWATLSGIGVTSFSAGTTGLTPSAATSGAITLAGTLIVANGGTGATTLTGYVKGSGTSALTASATIPATDISGGAALTKTDDTNVTLTLGGTPASALLAATSLTLGWSGQLSVARGGTGQSSYTDGQLLIGNSTGNTLTKATLTAGTNVSITNGSGAITINATDQFVGTVTSVSGTGTVSGLTLTGTVTTSGSLTLGGTLAVTASDFASQTAKTFLAAPNASSGVPSFRAIIPADVPTLNQNTTGTASNVTGTVAVGNGGTGTATAFTTGSVVFAGASGVYSQDNANLFWDDTNNRLGIGTASPAYRLDVAGTVNTTQALRFSASHFEGAATYSISNYLTNMVFNVPTGSGFGWAINGGDTMILNSSGNLGIGTSSPSVKLEVAGELKVGTGGTGAINGVITINGSGNASYGSVLVGQRNGSNTYAIGDTSALFGSGTGLSNFVYGAHPWSVYTNSSERMRITSGGDVGIGTTVPYSKLDTAASGGATIGISNTASGGGILYGKLAFYSADAAGAYKEYGGQIQSYSGAGIDYGDLRFYTANAAVAAERMRITSAGDVGIGLTAPSSALQVNGNIRVSNGTGFATGNSLIRSIQSMSGSSNQFVSNSIDFYTAAFTDNGQIAFSTGTVERMRIDGSGNVGIGTTSPAYRFDVRSGATATAIYANSTATTAYSATSYNGTGARMFLVGGNSSGAANGIQFTQGGSSELFFGGVQEAGGASSFVFQGYNGSAYAERMRINSSGNLLVGTTSATGARVDVYNSGSGDATVRIGNAQNALTTDVGKQGSTTYGATGAGESFLYAASNLSIMSDNGAGVIKFSAGGNAERARIDASGNLLVGTTTSLGKVTVESASGNCRAVNVLTGASVMDQFYFNGTATGNISTNGVTASYNTTSDLRLKDNITDADDAASLIDAIQVRKFDWKADGSHQRYGFVAQELVTVAPEAVSQPADPDDMMGVDYSKLVPMLVKEIQSLRARVAQLEGN